MSRTRRKSKPDRHQNKMMSKKEKKKLKKLEQLEQRQMSKEKLVAVYGSLRKGLYNNSILKDSRYMGRFTSKPIFNLYDLGSFPGLTENGSTSVMMEVFSVDEKILKKLDELEGYCDKNPNSSFYLRETMTTPYGLCYVYLYNSEPSEDNKVLSSDWKDYLETKRQRNLKTV